MSRQNLSRADQLYVGRASFPAYQGDKYGVETTPYYQFKPVGSVNAVLTAAPAAGATSGVLTAAWTGPSGLLPITFSDGEVLMGLFANGSTAVTYFPGSAPITGGSYTSNSFAGLVNACTTAIVVGNIPPQLGVANGYATSQAVGAGAAANLNGSLVSSGVGTPDVPRNVVGAWTTASTVTVTGTDMYGQAQTESQTGTTFTGKKAFATITSIVSSAAITAATFGTGSALGLPFCVGSGDIADTRVADAADAGTFAAADLTNPATSTSGDVRGTYAPSAALNGAKYVSALIKVFDRTTQVGAFGVTPA